MQFARMARELGRVAAEDGYRSPTFRSPPGRAGVQRSIRRRADGSATVAVAVRGRPAAGVVADMIDGVVAANRLAAVAGAELRDRLWAAAAPMLATVGSEASPSARRAA